ncbi:MAG TPA: hypothetical protein VFW07_14275 [Parafilimonas sp.]|nr:hypothetical protein [Parafilimonas sp.]
MKSVTAILQFIVKANFLPVLLATVSCSCLAQDISYLQGMPKLNNALESIQGYNKVDTYARQAAAYGMLQDMVAIMSGKLQGRQITFEEELLMKHYEHEIEKLRKQYQNERSSKDPWMKAISKYGSDSKLRAEVTSILTPDVRTYYVKKKSEYDNYLAGKKSSQAVTVEHQETKNPQQANSITMDEVDLQAMLPGGRWFFIDCEENIKSAYSCRRACLYNKIREGMAIEPQNVSAYLLMKIVEMPNKQDASSQLLTETLGQTIGSAAGISVPSQKKTNAGKYKSGNII